MGTYQNSSVIWECYLIYLRKSRQDDPNETVEEVLSKHETILQEYAMREFGGRIPEGNIYREVVSGESIEEREEIKKVLSRIEDNNIRGVLVIEPQRLSRGDLIDCGTLISNFQYTSTSVVTPVMTYNLDNKMERKFFQDELLRGRDYLEYTKEILWRGRVAAVKRGCYINPIPPFGFDRIKIGKDWTLTPNDEADTVRQIFEWYVKDDLSLRAIAKRLQATCPTRNGGNWTGDTVRCILANVHYIGKVRFNFTKDTPKVENGVRVIRRVKQSEEEVIIAEGKHDAIIPMELFEAAQNRIKNNPRTYTEKGFVNILAGLLKCKKCGKAMRLVKSRPTEIPRYYCKQEAPQHYKSLPNTFVLDVLATVLKEVELPKLQTKVKNGDGNAAVLQKRRLEKLSKQMEEYRQQEDKQYELLETGKYTQELFDRRNSVLRGKIEICEKEILQARASIPKNINYEDKVVLLEKAIEALENPLMPVKEKNRILRSIIKRIDYSAVDLGYNKGADLTLEVELLL